MCMVISSFVISSPAAFPVASVRPQNTQIASIARASRELELVFTVKKVRGRDGQVRASLLFKLIGPHHSLFTGASSPMSSIRSFVEKRKPDFVLKVSNTGSSWCFYIPLGLYFDLEPSQVWSLTTTKGHERSQKVNYSKKNLHFFFCLYKNKVEVSLVFARAEVSTLIMSQSS